MLLLLLEAVLYELIGAFLLDIVIEPGQVEFVHAEADEVEEGLDVVEWSGERVYLVLAD